MSKLRIRLNPYPDLKRNDNLHAALIERTSRNNEISRLISKTKDKKKHIRIMQKEIQEFAYEVHRQLTPPLQFYFKSKQITVSALERGMLGDRNNNGKAEGFHIEVLDLLIIYINDDINSNFFDWIGSSEIEEVSRYMTAFHIENNRKIQSLDELYASHYKANNHSFHQKNISNNLRKEITIPRGISIPSDVMDIKEFIYMELVKDNFQETINILGSLIKQNIPDLYIAIITIASDLNDLNRREIIGQISQNDFRIGINLVKERIYKLMHKVIR